MCIWGWVYVCLKRGLTVGWLPLRLLPPTCPVCRKSFQCPASSQTESPEIDTSRCVGTPSIFEGNGRKTICDKKSRISKVGGPPIILEKTLKNAVFGCFWHSSAPNQSPKKKVQRVFSRGPFPGTLTHRTSCGPLTAPAPPAAWKPSLPKSWKVVSNWRNWAVTTLGSWKICHTGSVKYQDDGTHLYHSHHPHHLQSLIFIIIRPQSAGILEVFCRQEASKVGRVVWFRCHPVSMTGQRRISAS